MSQAQSSMQLQVPSSLADQLGDFRRQVWKTKIVEAAAVAISCVAGAYLAVFAVDRLIDTPAWVRAGIALLAAAACGIVPYYLYRWVWSYRGPMQLARLLARKLPRVGDQLLGVLELAASETEQARSYRLCQAAIEQVADDAKHRDFAEAMPPTRVKLALSTAGATIGLGLLLLAVYPLAARNAWARFVAPWGGTARYTFAAVEPLPEQFVVPHGEAYPFEVRLAEGSAWQPTTARLDVGGAPLTATYQDGSYQFNLPPQIVESHMHLRVGDWTQRVDLQPKLRPELQHLAATVTLPEYLQRTAPLHHDVRGAGLSLVKGSAVSLAATASRELRSATADGVEVAPAGATFTTSTVDVDQSRELELTWTDIHGLQSSEPLRLALTAEDDAPPTLMCEGLPRKKVVLDSEQLKFQVVARDDFGVRKVGMTWKGVGGDFVETPAAGDRPLAAGSPDSTSLDVEGTFTATSLGITPQPVEVQIYTTDYFPDREPVYSPKYLLFVLDAEQHAIWITEQLAAWHRQSLEVRDRELRLYETNKQLRALDPSELDQPDARRQLESQAAAERANGRRLSSLTQTGAELLRQAARNPEIGVGHLDRWAEMLQILQDISANRMPSVADLLNEGADAQSKPSRVAAQPRPAAGQARAAGSGNGAEQKPEEKNPTPPIPSVVDMESTQQPPIDGEAKEPDKKNPSNPTLRLPTTTLMGKASNKPKPEGQQENVEQAVVEQRDLLEEFEKVANELNEILANLEGSTLVKRLKAESRKQYRIAGAVGEDVSQSFGVRTRRQPDEVEKKLDGLAGQVDISTYNVSLIMDDMQAYFERRRMVKFKTVLEQMRQEDVIGGLRRLSEDVKTEPGISIAQSEYWSDTLDRWAEDLVDPSNCGACPGSRAKGSLPPSIVLEVLQILEGEMNLREETRVAEQAKAELEADEYELETTRLSTTQFELQQRVMKVVDRILELPDAEAEFAREIKLLRQVDSVMLDATEILALPETGGPAIAAETEAIELLLQSRRINPNGGGGGGANPGGGGTGDTQDSALALLGAGLNAKEVREAPEIVQAVGTSTTSLPEEFRAGLDQYFNELEDPHATQ